MAIFKMRANICTYFKNGSQLVSSAQNIDILSGSPNLCLNRHKNLKVNSLTPKREST